MEILLFLLILWVLLNLVGVFKPQFYISVTKWKMRYYGQMLGFDVVPRSDEIILKRIRIWCACIFVIGVLLLWLVLT